MFALYLEALGMRVTKHKLPKLTISTNLEAQTKPNKEVLFFNYEVFETSC